MAMNNNERVGKALDFLAEGLKDPVDGVMTRLFHTEDWASALAKLDQEKYGGDLRTLSGSDVYVQLRAITEFGKQFNALLTRSQQAYASELRDVRNKWAHGDTFDSDEALRAMNTIQLLLEAVDAPDSAADVQKLHDQLERSKYEDRTRKMSQRQIVSVDPGKAMKPWREVIKPHSDIADGTFSNSEFAADLYQVAVSKTACVPGNAYGDPHEFFSRTYLTEGLRDLLSRAIKRLVGDGQGSPVVNLQTNFGGGKTHSMLALYHLFGDMPVNRLSADIENLITDLGQPQWNPNSVKRVAIVGTQLHPGSPDEKPDGTKVNTIWGELAWQLGGREAYDIVAEDDAKGVSPGDKLNRLLAKYSPCLILIDEWVAYARQLLERNDMPAGTFDTQFTFAQTLTEAVTATPHAMLVLSIPASEDGDKASEAEVGGSNGRKALERLQNVVRRQADQWKPSTRDESFEIVRKRLFEEPDAEGQEQIALTAHQFVKMYRDNSKLFPQDSAVPGREYEQRIRASYPLHPELLDRLYEDWSTLSRFQRTRGVLKLVSSIVHELWVNNDTNPLILPGVVPLDADSVNTNLTQYLDDNWKPMIDADIAGNDATAAQIDHSHIVLGARMLTQRIANTIFIGSAPRSGSDGGVTNRGISEQDIRLGALIPGDSLGNFGTALGMLKDQSTYLFSDEGRYWYSTQPSIIKKARDYAEQYAEDSETIFNQIRVRLGNEAGRAQRGDFHRVCVAPEDSSDIPDVDEATLVIVHPRWSMSRGEGDNSATKQWICDAIERCGTSQRVNRNMVVFLVADTSMLEMAQSAVCTYLGWKKVLNNKVSMNLSQQDEQQSQKAVSAAEDSLTERIGTAFHWCVYPFAAEPTRPYRLEEKSVQDSAEKSMAQRVSEVLRNSDNLNRQYNSGLLGADVIKHVRSAFSDGVISVGQIWNYMTRFSYMPRFTDRSVLNNALEGVLNMPADPEYRFALAAGRDPETGYLQNLIIPGVTDTSQQTIHVTDSTLVVDWDVANKQYQETLHELENAKQQSELQSMTESFVDERGSSTVTGSDVDENFSLQMDTAQPTGSMSGAEVSINGVENPSSEVSVAVKKRFFGTVSLDSETMNRQLVRINEGVLDQLRMAGARLTIRLDIEATQPDGFSPDAEKLITKNAKALGFKDSGFEDE